MAKIFDPKTNVYIDTDDITTALVPETVRNAMKRFMVNGQYGMTVEEQRYCEHDLSYIKRRSGRYPWEASEREMALEDENTILHRKVEELMNALHEVHAERAIESERTKHHVSEIVELRSRFDRLTYMYSTKFHIKKVIFNAPATIVYWADGTKTVVKCSENDIYDAEKGLAMCFAKRAMANSGSYYNIFKEWLPKEEERNGVTKDDVDKLKIVLTALLSALDEDEE